MNDEVQHNGVDDDGDDDRDLQGEDLDAFLLFLESRLRADFTSPDLVKIISSQGTSLAPSRGGSGGGSTTNLPSGNPSSPSKFVRLIDKVFDHAAKPIKLRALVSMLGLEPDRMIEASSAAAAFSLPGDKSSLAPPEERKTDKHVRKLLLKAEKNDEMWARVVAGIIRGRMFRPSPPEGVDASEPENVNSTMAPACRGKAAERQLRKTVDNILKDVQKASAEGSEKLVRAEATLLHEEDDEIDDDETEHNKKHQQQEAKLESLLIGRDACPTLLPFRYSFLTADTLKSFIPEVDSNAHFLSDRDASVFKIDAEIEVKRAEEEGKELQLQKQRTAMNASAGRGRGGANGTSRGAARGGAPMATLAGRMRGRFSNNGRGGRAVDTAASLLRPNPTSLGGRGGRGRMGRDGRGAGGRLGAGRTGRLGGRGTGRLGSGRLGAGRSGTLTRQPLQRRVPGSTRAMLNASGRGGGDASKMKMIDVSEVEGLNRAQKQRQHMNSVEARKAERKRKLLEAAAASGLRANKDKKSAAPASKFGATFQNSGFGDRNRAESPSHQDDESDDFDDGAHLNNVDPFPLPNGSLDIELAPTDDKLDIEPFDTDHHDTNSSQQHHHQQQGWQSLLEKSNKLSDEDRQNIHQFFERRATSNPPSATEGQDSNVWKVKLNEEKTVDPQTGEVVKETLYLELDYGTFGYKKTRKIKRK